MAIIDKRTPKTANSGNALARFLFNKGLIKPGEKVLDFGSGSGRVAVPLSKQCTVKVIEGNEGCLANLLDCGFERPEPGEKFDVAMAFFVFQHNTLEKVRAITHSLSYMARRLVFTYPTHELLALRPGNKLKWVPAAELKEQPIPDCNHLSGVLHEAELPTLFETSEFDVSTLRFVVAQAMGKERVREIKSKVP